MSIEVDQHPRGNPLDWTRVALVYRPSRNQAPDHGTWTTLIHCRHFEYRPWRPCRIPEELPARRPEQLLGRSVLLIEIIIVRMSMLTAAMIRDTAMPLIEFTISPLGVLGRIMLHQTVSRTHLLHMKTGMPRHQP